MSKRKQNKKTLQKDIIIKRLRFFLIAALTIIIFYPPYLQGLFFEEHVLPTQIFVFIIFILFLIYKWLKNDYVFFKTPIEYICLGFVGVYFISIFVAVHTRSAIIEWLKYCMYFAVFYMISDLADNLKTKMIFLWTIVLSAVGVSIIGLDAAMGGNIVGILNKIFKVLGVNGDLFFGLFVENRIHSTLQYPNALASYLMAVFFVTVSLLMVYSKLWQKVILGSFAFILFSTFMLTQSRGVQLFFPIAVVILLITTPKGNRIRVVTSVLLLSIPSGVISLFLSPYLSPDTLNYKALLLMLFGLLVTVIISLVVNFLGNILKRVNWKIYIAIFSVSAIVITIVMNYVFNSSVPVELSLLNSEENKVISISKDVALEPNKEYILSFEAEGEMKEEKPYAFFVRLFNKNLNNILFYGSKQLIRKDFSATEGFEKFNILFRTQEDTKFINVDFSIYYSGTSVIINNVSIIEAETGKTVKKIILKNKYNLDNIISRFQNIWLQQSLVSRAIFYKDGINIFKNKWFLGAGGGAWNYLYRQYQSYNYASSQAHNYPLQLGIETGILGISILISLVIILFTNYIKYYRKVGSDNKFSSVITAISILLMHSVIDFDFAESSMLLLFWQLIALFNRELILSNVNMKEKRIKFTTDKKLTVFIGIIVSVITLYFSLSLSVASFYAKQSFNHLRKNDIEIAINKMEKAIKFDRYNEKYVLGYNPIKNRPEIKVGLIDILFIKNEKLKSAKENEENIPEADLQLFQKQLLNASSYIKEIEKKANNNLSLTSDLASYYFKTGEIDKGINYLNSAISYYPFEPSLWHSKVDVYYQLMKEYFNNQEYEKAKEYLIKGLNVIDEAKNINKRNMNPFVFNDNTVKLLQTMKFMQDNWNNDSIYEVNEIVYYSIIDLDINLDGIPDQLGVNNADLLNVSIYGGDLSILASDEAYIYTYYPIMLKNGKTYRVEIGIHDNIEFLYLYVHGITAKSIPFKKEGDKYTAELKVENEPSESGNQFRIYLKSNCKIENILIKEKK